jgi:hypothetical protein
LQVQNFAVHDISGVFLLKKETQSPDLGDCVSWLNSLPMIYFFI